MEHRRLGADGPSVSVLGYGAFKIGRNQKIKYADAYELPDERDAVALLNTVLDLGITYIDTAPAYGLSEQRIGGAIAHRRREFTLATKAGETFENGASTYDYSAEAIRRSVERSLRRLRTDSVDVLLIHSDGDDLRILDRTDAVETVCDLKRRGLAAMVGLSGKTVEGARRALAWADVLMVEYHADDRSHDGVMRVAAEAGVGVVVKKPLASGRLDPASALGVVVGHPSVSTAVVGTLRADHLRHDIAAVASLA